MKKITTELNSWIIQDGNYGDFHCGDHHSLALEFAGGSLVIFVNPEVWVIDFGIKAYWESPPPAFVQTGAWVEGEIFLGIDPFFYKDYLSKVPDMPNLFDEWIVKRIQLNTTPWIHSLDGDRSVLTRDGSLEARTDITATNAWNDDNGRASYLLHLER
jgi:hypothetical protein